MFEVQYNDEMAAEVRRLEAHERGIAAGHPEWANACATCGCEIAGVDVERCERCGRTEEAPDRTDRRMP